MKKEFIFTFFFFLSSCQLTELTSQKARSAIGNHSGEVTGKALVYEESPFILGGENYGVKNISMTYFLSKELKNISSKNDLSEDCSLTLFHQNIIKDKCYQVFSNQNTSTAPLQRNLDQSFIYDVDSSEFYQVNTFFHMRKSIEMFHQKLGSSFDFYENASTSLLHSSLPSNLSESQLFWFKEVQNFDATTFRNSTLKAFSDCALEGNAYFSPVGPSLCFGQIKELPSFKFVQDPSIIYHELGHAFISIMLNMRNFTNGQYHIFRSQLGKSGYTEAGALGEGIADYFSFIMNRREEFAEFALGKTYGDARPLSESSYLHKLDILSENSNQRLKYPHYLHYNANSPHDVIEGVHYAGQIVSHFLIALTKDIKKTCQLDHVKGDDLHEKSTQIVLFLLAETLSELGDLNGLSSDHFDSHEGYYFINLDQENSLLWLETINPVNFRKFFQTFGKKIKLLNLLQNPSICQGLDGEKILDDYGLLLFKNYHDHYPSTKDVNVSLKENPTEVDESTRNNSILVSKENLSLATSTSSMPYRSRFYIIDQKTNIDDILKSLLFKGFPVPLSTHVASTDYNNNNQKISPGEIIALIINLQNNSNTPMAGVQVLATDWDHVDIYDEETGYFSPCLFDSTTTEGQGAVTSESCQQTSSEFKRLIKDPEAQTFDKQALAPVCMVLSENENSTTWVSQNEYRKRNGLNLSDKDCLGYSSSDAVDQDFSFNPHECLVRFLPGKNDAYFSRIDPSKTYYETVINNLAEKKFNQGNLLLFEVNKWIPPGTQFRCRLRARFSNCSDCYENGERDYIDSEFNGAEPFQMINFDFIVND